jgi:hypothetical protein
MGIAHAGNRRGAQVAAERGIRIKTVEKHRVVAGQLDSGRWGVLDGQA